MVSVSDVVSVSIVVVISVAFPGVISNLVVVSG